MSKLLRLTVVCLSLFLTVGCTSNRPEGDEQEGQQGMDDIEATPEGTNP